MSKTFTMIASAFLFSAFAFSANAQGTLNAPHLDEWGPQNGSTVYSLPSISVIWGEENPDTYEWENLISFTEETIEGNVCVTVKKDGQEVGTVPYVDPEEVDWLNPIPYLNYFNEQTEEIENEDGSWSYPFIGAAGINVNFGNLISGSGTYEVEIPAGLVQGENGDLNEAVIYTFIYIQEVSAFEATITPNPSESGEVWPPVYEPIYAASELEEVKVTWNDYTMMINPNKDKDIVATYQPEDSAQGGNPEEVILSAEIVSNAIVLNLSNLHEGVWVIDIPQGYLLLDETSVNESLQFFYNINSDEGTGNTPAGTLNTPHLDEYGPQDGSTVYTLPSISVVWGEENPDTYEWENLISFTEQTIEGNVYVTVKKDGQEVGTVPYVDPEEIDWMNPIPYLNYYYEQTEEIENEDGSWSFPIIGAAGITVNFGSLISGSGTYEVEIPAGLVQGENGDLNEAVTYTFYYISEIDGYDAVINPEPSQAEYDQNWNTYYEPVYSAVNLSHVTISWEGFTMTEGPSYTGTITATLAPDDMQQGGEAVTADIYPIIDEDTNEIVVDLSNLEVGVWQFSIPQGYVYLDGTSVNGVVDLTYYIDQATGIADLIEAESYDVYTINGVKVISNGSADSLSTLAPGLYIVNGKKVVIRK